jgi:hypothetical protein
MNYVFPLVMLLGSTCCVCAQQSNSVSNETRAIEGGTTEYFDADGRLIGTVTKIGGVIYLAGPDGSPLGTVEQRGSDEGARKLILNLNNAIP